ncbi:MAG TPA: hypothetical protein V6C81_24065 [Planktothrix sp.]|jgi:hypothetical protein
MNLRITLSLLTCLILCGCSTSTPSNQNFSLESIPQSKIRAEIINQASHLGIVDGYYFGEEARNFKTEYLLTKPDVKADFALAYEDMLSKQNEDMLHNWKSYVAYSKRAEFARTWWSAHSAAFNKQSEKMKILWMHEAILDGGELWWRAVEKLASNQMTSPAVLTHDEEQHLVFDYAEDENSRGSLSTQSAHFH